MTLLLFLNWNLKEDCGGDVLLIVTQILTSDMCTL